MLFSYHLNPRTHTPSFTFIARMQCCMALHHSIRGQIIMSHYFHIKKKSIIISIVLVKFLTIVRCVQDSIRERDAIKIRTQRTSACVTRDSPRKLQFSKLTPKKFVESAHTKPRRSMIAIGFDIHLSFTMSSMLRAHGLRFLHNKHFGSTLLSSNIRPILFEFCDPQSRTLNAYIQYNMELSYILILAKTRKTTLESQATRDYSG